MPIEIRGGLRKIIPAAGAAVRWEPLDVTISPLETKAHQVSYGSGGKLLRLVVDKDDKLLAVELLEVAKGQTFERAAGERHVIVNIGGGAVDGDKSGGGNRLVPPKPGVDR